ncbi:MAG: hypothetical protein M3R25_11955 [Bacteroidota bacterium]|nr:hypothetical protein [Bacteroidota bacterium]
MSLSIPEYRLWIKTHQPLLHYTGIRYGIIPPEVSYKDFISDFNMRDKFEYREAFLKHPDILEEYLEKKRKKLLPDHVTILHNLRKKMTGTYVIYKFMPKGAIFFDQHYWYYVWSLGDTFEQFIEQTPSVVNATLVPFRDKIIYDGFLQPSSVSIGSNIRNALRQLYAEAKENGHIIKRLD